jgi:hypothetical protein
MWALPMEILSGDGDPTAHQKSPQEKAAMSHTKFANVRNTTLKGQQMQRRQQLVKSWQVSAPKDATQRREFITKPHIPGLEAAYLLPPTIERRPHQG